MIHLMKILVNISSGVRPYKSSNSRGDFVVHSRRVQGVIVLRIAVRSFLIEVGAFD